MPSDTGELPTSGRTPPTSIKEKETHWLEGDASPHHHKAQEQRGLVETLRVTGTLRLQDLVVRRVIVFNRAPRGGKFVSILYRMGMKLTHAEQHV
eukprot:1160890-Pelagomonas_calceolata.AAC.1